jgi:ABC-type multidrug transport system fused ATPase/permease subunit
VIDFYRRLWPILSSKTRRRLVAAALMMTVVASLEAVALLLLVPLLQLLTSNDFSATSPAITKFGELFGRQGSALAAVLAVAALGVYVAKGFGAIAVLRWASRFAMEEEASLVTRLMRLYLGAPLEVHFDTNTAAFQRTINQSLRTIFSQAFVIAFSAAGDLLGVALIGVILLASAPGLTLVGLGYFAVVLFAYQRVVNHKIVEASQQVHRDQLRIFRDVQQALAAVKEIKAGAVEGEFIDHISRSRRLMLRSYRTIALMSVQPRYVLELMMIGAAAVVAAFAYSTEAAAAATASIAIFLAGGFRILAPLTKVISGLSTVRSARPAVGQIRDDLVRLGARADAQLAEPAERVVIEPRIEVRGVRFSYDGVTPVLRGVDFDVAPGEFVALLGGSGAGKSTMVDLLLGLLEPSGGTIRVSGHVLGEVRRDWQRSVGYVPQTISLLDTSVRDNVVFGWPAADDERVWKSLADAQLTDVVAALPDGLETRIGERGVRLSGGQRQRLGIARALYREPVLLVLDEATSALDNETEAQFTAVLQGLQGRVTTVAIAHRLSTVRDVDRAYYLDGGRVVDCGTFDELARRVPEFARLVELSSVAAGGGHDGDH